ncbi:DUF2177 family protein [Anaerorhabdus sp.]|uniref:DUF2177 family protein n=1 Tax=Anaerorhabdus sp. TaxID=1872524 RepID=UPI002B2173B8|nr:DUF2177 family protein [Anaerorhabdus sp.]MEA4875531.1 DUF2177 family protein [Anaerorhabdus sp.]
MTNVLKNIGITLLIFIVIDGIWLFLMRNFYSKQLGELMTTNVKWLSALIFYVLFVIALYYFVINPALISGDIKVLVISAVLFGLVTYGTYDLTNYATLNNWPLTITIIDLCWGSFVSTAVALISFFILK